MDNIQKVAKQGSSTSCATFDEQSYGKHVSSGNNLNQVNKYPCEIYAGHTTSFLPESGQDEVPHIGEIEHQEKTSKHTRVELVPSKSAIGSFGREISSAIRVMYDLQSHNCSLKSDEALKHRLFERSLSSPSDSRNYKMMDPIYFEYLQKTFKEPIETFEYGVASCSSSNPDFSQRLASNADPGMAGCSNSSHDFTLQQTVRSQSRLDQAQQSIPPPAQEGLAELTLEERKTVLKLRERRLKLGKKQIDLIPELSKLSGVRFRVSWLSDFENFRLGPMMMRHLIPFFNQCLQNIEKSRKAEEHQLSYELNRE